MADLLNDYRAQNGDKNLGGLTKGQTNTPGAQPIPTTQQNIDYGWGVPKESNPYILPLVVLLSVLVSIVIGLLIYKRHKTNKTH